MNALVKKEIRLLLPSFLIGLALAFSMLLVPKDLSGNNWKFLFVVGMICCPAMVVMMSLDSFGRELSAGTLANLLVQPVPRVRIWWIKSGLLFVALAIVFAVWWVSWLLGWPVKASSKETREMLLATGIFVLTMYSGGLWTVLLLRQVAAAFWFTLLVPGAILLGLVYLLSEKHPEHLMLVIVTALSIYSIAGFLFAWRLFLRAQDVQWTGGAISLPQWRFLPAVLTGTGAKRGRRPLRAMFAREFQLHQSQLVIAGGLALLHLGVLVARGIGHGFKQYPTVDFVLGHLWYLWLVMPVLVGCAAVAEERKLGTLESELCLPVRRRTQFATKLKVMLLLSVLLGAVMPLLLEGSKILPNTHLDTNSRPPLEFFIGSLGQTFGIIFNWLVLISDWLGLLIFAAICAGIGAIAFYFSTLSRHTLQALGPAILGCFATVYLLWAAFLPERLIDCVLWRGFLVYLIGVPTLTLTLAWLAYWNYKRVLVGWPAWRRNLLTLLAAFTFVIASTTALYHRAWELVLPLEPKQHGPARLATSPRVMLQNVLGWLGVGIPDGRFWSGNYGYSLSLKALLTSDWRLKELSGGSQFLAGTNWADVADCIYDTVGIQKDGSLWVSKKSLPREFYYTFWKHQSPPAKPSAFVRAESDDHWKSVVSSGRNVLLLKDDGTLWTWGTDRPNPPSGWPGLIALPLERVGTDSDWAVIERISYGFCLRKKDGRAWSNIYSDHQNDSDAVKLFGSKFGRSEILDQHQWGGATRARAAKGQVGGFLVSVRDDGTFRVMAQWQQSRLAAQDIQIGPDTNWVAVVGSYSDVVITLKADGSLWRWSFADDPGTKPDSAIAERLGKHSDWVAISSIGGGIVTLSADGGLWYWRFDPRHVSNTRELLMHPLIGVSRKPVRIAGIFDKAE